MKDELERYIRALAEQEESTNAPETLQDLGTFVHWLLERLGYTIHVRAFKQTLLDREKITGRLQLGVDILATKADGDSRQLYRFVLKHGSVDKTVWGQSGKAGNIVHDVRLAADKSVTRDWEDHIFQGQKPERVTVVAVHNGPFDSPTLGGSRKQLEETLRKGGIDLAWWDVSELVRLAAPFLSSAPDGEEAADAGVFPPGVRPFARLALDSLRRQGGAAFDLRAVDDFLEIKLPLGREPTREGATERLRPGKRLPTLQLHRRSAEVALFTAMIAVESKLSAGGLTLPTFDAIERCVCRIAEHAQRHGRASPDADLRSLRAVVENLLRQYVREAQALADRLRPLRSARYGMALGLTSEQVDYPLRCLRLLGYLAVAGLACLDLRGEGCDEAQAHAFAEGIFALWQSNEAACESPVTDDQGIELGAIWHLFLRLGRHADVGRMSRGLVHRLVIRRRLGLPLPGLYQLAKTPMAERDMRALAEAYVLRNEAFGFDDNGSTLLALAAYLAYRHGALEPASLTPLQGDEKGGRGSKPCYVQAWRPPAEAADEWYAHPLLHWGFTKVFECLEDKARFMDEFERHAEPVMETYARWVNLPVVDLMAWKRWRTLPDYSLFISKNASGAEPSASPQASAAPASSTQARNPGREASVRAKAPAKRRPLTPSVAAQKKLPMVNSNTLDSS